MVKTLSAIQARQNLGQVMNEVSLRGDEYVIERAGKPLVAIISMEKYRILEKERAEALRSLGVVWRKMDAEQPEAIDETIREAVTEVRRP